MNRIHHALLQVALIFFLTISVAVQAGAQVFTVAVVPQYASSQVFRDWVPLLTKLEKVTGYHFKLLAYDEFSAFEKDFSNGVPDLIYLNPYHLLVAKKQQNYQPLVRDSLPINGILVVSKDGPIKSLEDLNGKKIAFPSPNALGASLYMRALLAEKMHIKFKPKYVGSHQNVYREVMLGEAAAGGGIQRTFNKEPNGLTNKLSILYNTPDIASHPLAAHPRVSASVRKKIIEALIASSKDPESEKLLAAIQMPQPVKADYQKDYSGLVKLKLDQYYENRSN